MATRDPRFGFDPVAAFLGDRKVRKAPEPSVSDVPRSVTGLCQLSRACAWAAVLDLSASLLSEHDDLLDEVAASDQGDSSPERGQGRRRRQGASARAPLQPHERLECVAFRSLALLQTGQVERARDAIAQLGSLAPESTNHVYESFPEAYPPTHAQSGSFVPFALRALALEVQARASAPAAIDDLYALRHDCAQRAAAAPAGEDQALWRAREALALSSIAAAHLRAGQHDAAADAARALAVQQGATARARFMYARVLLHIGDLAGARRAISDADKCEDCTPPLRLVHEALALAAEGALDDAAVQYDAAAALCSAEDGDGDDDEIQMVWAFAVNNASICLVHLGQLTEAIDRIEGALRQNPRIALDEGIVCNIVTLYDLAFPDTAAERKGVIKALASKYGRQGFDLSVTAE